MKHRMHESILRLFHKAKKSSGKADPDNRPMAPLSADMLVTVSRAAIRIIQRRYKRETMRKFIQAATLALLAIGANSSSADIILNIDTTEQLAWFTGTEDGTLAVSLAPNSNFLTWQNAFPSFGSVATIPTGALSFGAFATNNVFLHVDDSAAQISANFVTSSTATATLTGGGTGSPFDYSVLPGIRQSVFELLIGSSLSTTSGGFSDLEVQAASFSGGGGGGGAAAVPEPSSVAMMGVICGGAGYRRWRKRRSAANVA